VAGSVCRTGHYECTGRTSGTGCQFPATDRPLSTVARVIPMQRDRYARERACVRAGGMAD